MLQKEESTENTYFFKIGGEIKENMQVEER